MSIRFTKLLFGFGLCLPLASLAGVTLERQPALPNNAGINVHFYEDPGGMNALATVGVRWLRMDFIWEIMEKQKGVYDFSLPDILMKRAREQGVNVLAIIDYSHPLYEKKRKVVTAAGREAYARFAVALAKRYAGQNVVWEFWNEPNNRGFWPGNRPEEYMELVKEASRAMRAEVPGVVLLGPALYRMDDTYMEACLKLGLLDYVDAVSFHPYRRERPEDLIGDMARLRRLMAAYRKPDRPEPLVVCGEWGFSATHHTAEGQALRLPRALFLSMMEGMSLFIYYDVINDGGSLTNSEHHYGLFTAYPYLVPKPAALTYMTAVRVMAGFHFQRRIAPDGAAASDLFVLEFANPAGEKRYVHWTSLYGDDKTATWILPASMGPVSRVTQDGQRIDDTYAPGTQVSSRSQVEYLLPVAGKQTDAGTK